jgi:hypothetical protein
MKRSKTGRSSRKLKPRPAKYESFAPSRDDLAIDLYIQLREVERCLDRFPDQLPGAARRLVVLVRRYNQELVWTYPYLPRDNTPVRRMGESVRL